MTLIIDAIKTQTKEAVKCLCASVSYGRWGGSSARDRGVGGNECDPGETSEASLDSPSIALWRYRSVINLRNIITIEFEFWLFGKLPASRTL